MGTERRFADGRTPAHLVDPKEIALLGRELAERLVFDEALALAHHERTGKRLADGEEYSRADRNRALKIIELYPKPDVGA